MTAEVTGATRPAVVGHRGAGDLEPENTLAAFSRAIELELDAVELDVRLTRDGHPVLLHDERLDRTTGGSGPVAEHDLSELRSLDAGGGQPPPTLSVALDLLRGSDLAIQIELKGSGTEVPAVDAVRRAALTDRVVFTSFFHQRVLVARELLPGCRTGILVACNPVEPLVLLETARADFLHAKSNVVDQRLVDAVHAGGRQLRAWGPNRDAASIDRLIALGVDAIGSDRPDRVVDRLRARSHPIERLPPW